MEMGQAADLIFWGGIKGKKHEDDELNMSQRKQTASFIINLGNKLINEVNEEEQSWLWTKQDF